jgi:hypothetical protein
MKNAIDELWEKLKKQSNIIISSVGDIEVIQPIDSSKKAFLIKCKAEDLTKFKRRYKWKD